MSESEHIKTILERVIGQISERKIERKIMKAETIKIDNIDIPVLGKEFQSANILTVKVGTTGYRGGDSGHGGRTVFALRMGGGDLRLNYDNSKTCQVDSIDIILGGDCELETFLNGLRFAIPALESLISLQRNENEDKTQ